MNIPSQHLLCAIKYGSVPRHNAEQNNIHVFRRGGKGQDMFLHTKMIIIKKNRSPPPTKQKQNKSMSLSLHFVHINISRKLPPLPPKLKKKGGERRGGACGTKGGWSRGRWGRGEAGEASPMCLLPPTSPPLCLSLLGAGTLQHTQVVVLFGHTQLEAVKRVVEMQGCVLGCQRAGEDGHDGV